MTEELLNLSRRLILLAICCAVCFFAGCDLGTYNQRFDERLKKTDTGAVSLIIKDNGDSARTL